MRERTSLRPCCGSKSTIRAIGKLEGNAHGVGGTLPDRISPPVNGEATFGQLYGEEDEDETEGNTTVESSGKDVVVPHPPSKVEATHAVVENESNRSPGGIVNPRGGWDCTNATEEDRNIDVSPERERIAASEEVEWNGENSADEIEEKEGVVRCADATKSQSVSKSSLSMINTYENILTLPTPPQINDDVAKVLVEGQVKPLG